ncbi:enoyl-CoA hydratase/isomerase family protein [Sphingobium sp. SA916]|uniref:enoyl-CoA hydratase/isomerase family protein n=1 Tax=Sphingobium sp. SA916 TaxID=1851207 RepID=UPI000C9F6AD7|nr:enoyl-CoA hydratase-related protein [Sphingobium sp. SA916]PNP96737.1 enoyl-CoA hydratase [Sphingobium sp. SA916]
MADAAVGEFETVTARRIGEHVLLISLDRPEAANALNTQMGRDLLTLFSGLNLDAQNLRSVVITGAGDRHFCAGGDLRERDGMSDQAWLEQHVLFEHAFYALMDCPLPVIAAVNGAAIGGGCELALACDFIFASERARFGQPEVKLGIIPGGGGTQTLTRAVGAARAKELILSGQVFTPQEALAWGMVNRIFPPDQLLEQALATARAIAAAAPVAVRSAKLAITRGAEVDRRTGLALEIAAYNQTVTTQDRREGVRAALEKRNPEFEGR